MTLTLQETMDLNCQNTILLTFLAFLCNDAGKNDDFNRSWKVFSFLQANIFT